MNKELLYLQQRWLEISNRNLISLYSREYTCTMPQHNIQMHCFNAEVFCTKLFRLFSPLIHYAVFLVFENVFELLSIKKTAMLHKFWFFIGYLHWYTEELYWKYQMFTLQAQKCNLKLDFFSFSGRTTVFWLPVFVHW